MQISKVIIKNFRNFENLEIELGRNVILLGENSVGKTNFLEALRLVLDPSRERRLYREDFHRSITPFQGTKIEVHLFFSDFADDQILLGRVFRDCIIQDTPPIAQISYLYFPKENIEEKNAVNRDDYQALIYGKGEINNDVRTIIRSHLSLRVIPALRDIDRDIAVWQNSPLRQLTDLMSLSDQPEFQNVATSVGRATQALQQIPPIKQLQETIQRRLTDMVEGSFAINPQVGMLPSDPEALQRALRLFVDENLSLDRSSLGLANVLYLTLLMLEIEQRKQQTADDEDQGEKYHFTILAVEEPEAHLHPHLQRLVFRDFQKWQPPVFLSTHSPHIVSVAEADSLMVLKRGAESKTTATSTACLSSLPEWEPDWPSAKLDLERYLDATRGEVAFAKGVILVEGDAELFLIPAFAKAMKEAGQIPCSLDGAGVSICSVAGTDFKPYVRFLGSDGLQFPMAVITDGDKYVKSENGLERGAKLAAFIKREIVPDLENLLKDECWDDLRQVLSNIGIFVNEWTLEAELSQLYAEELIKVYGELGASIEQQNNMRMQLQDGSREAMEKIIRRIEETGKGKGRFAQRLASKVQADRIPPYIQAAILYVLHQVAPTPTEISEPLEELEV